MGETLATLCGEIEADQRTLEQVMERFEVKRNRSKVAAAWAAEKLGRLKLNGRLSGYSPLSRLLELEMLQIGIAAKLALWQALERTQSVKLAQFDLAGLIERAQSQRATVEGLRLDAARAALAQEPG